MTARMLAQRQPPFEDRVTAHWPRIPAPKMIGTQAGSRSRGSHVRMALVGERRARLEASPRGGVERARETMQASVTTRRVRIPSTANPRIPGPGSSPQGKPGPKARPKGVADGQQANIPAPGRGATRATPRPDPAAVQEATAAQAGAPLSKARRGPPIGREKRAER